MFNSFGPTEIIIIALFILVFFGAKRIPELAKGLGQGIQEFRKASRDIKKEIEETSRDIEETVKNEDNESAK